MSEQEKLKPVSPVEVLITEFLIPWAVTYIHKQSKDMPHIADLLEDLVTDHDKKVNDHVARALSKFTGTSAQFWLNLQEQYDKETKSGE